MSIITSNEPKRQSIVDPILIMMFISVLVVLLVFAVSAANRNLLGSVLQSYDNIPSGLSLNSEVSFASDQRYWVEFCDSGWSSNAVCDAIVARAQACTASVDSAYCSAYVKYLQEFGN